MELISPESDKRIERRCKGIERGKNKKERRYLISDKKYKV